MNIDKAMLRLMTTPGPTPKRATQRKDNKSGHVGVCWVPRRNKWEANIQIGGKQEYLGMYDDFEAAVAAYLKAKPEKLFPNAVEQDNEY